MKYSATIKYDEYSVEYIVMATDKKEAIEKIRKISGQLVTRVKEI